MKRFTLTLAGLVLAVGLDSAWAAGPDDILGTYWNPERTRKVEITRQGATYIGTVIWEAAPEPAGSLIGRVIARGFRFDGNESWVDGEVISPLDGEVFSGRLWLEDGNLMMRGFVGISLLGRTATMERVR